MTAALWLVLAFMAPATMEKVAVADLVRDTAKKLGCGTPAVFIETDAPGGSWIGRVECRDPLPTKETP